MINLLILDNFHQKPYEVREFALKQDFNVDGNYPGHRTRSFLKDLDFYTGIGPNPIDVERRGEKYQSTIMQKIADVLRPIAGEITWWGEEEYTGAFQYTTAKDRSWIHVDHITSWAGVWYLTPYAPVSSGTGLFKHKLTGWTTEPYFDDGNVNQTLKDLIYSDSWDMTKWDMQAMVGNIFNRLVLYRANQWHQSLDYFGRTKDDGRLFMTFFFNTEI